MKAAFGGLLATAACVACGAVSEKPVSECQTAGECARTTQAFVCQVDVPPQAAKPPTEPLSGDFPSLTGGAIPDGQYTISRVSFSGTIGSVPGETLEFRDGFYHRNHTTYSAINGDAMTGFEETGAYETTGSTLSLEGAACLGPGTPSRTVTWQYSVRGSQLEILKTSGQDSWLELYERN